VNRRKQSQTWAEPDKRRLVNAGDPVVSVEVTEALRDRWVTSGRVSYSLERGDAAAIGGLECPYRDAPTQSDAIAQSLDQMQSVIRALTELKDRLVEAAKAETETS
jgi:hypothetical protein